MMGKVLKCFSGIFAFILQVHTLFYQASLSLLSAPLAAVVEGLLFDANYLQPWEIYLRVAQLPPFGSRRCWKIVLGVLGSTGHEPIHAPRWWHFLRNNCKGVEYCVGKFNTVWVTLSSCFSDMYTMAPMMLHWRTEITSSYSMCCPSSSHIWFFMNNYLCSKRG